MTDAPEHLEHGFDFPTPGEVLFDATADSVGPAVSFPPGAVYPTISRAGPDRLVVMTMGSTTQPLVPRDVVVLSATEVALTLHRIVPREGVSTADARITAYVVTAPGISPDASVTVRVGYSFRDGVDQVVLPPTS